MFFLTIDFYCESAFIWIRHTLDALRWCAFFVNAFLFAVIFFHFSPSLASAIYTYRTLFNLFSLFIYFQVLLYLRVCIHIYTYSVCLWITFRLIALAWNLQCMQQNTCTLYTYVWKIVQKKMCALQYTQAYIIILVMMLFLHLKIFKCLLIVFKLLIYLKWKKKWQVMSRH